MTTTAKTAGKIQVTNEEKYEVMKKVCHLTNLQLNDKINTLLDKRIAGTASEREIREAVILAQVYGNRERHK